MKHTNKAIIAAAIATALFSGTAFAVSGNPENPDASTKNWQLDELRQSVNNQFSDVNNRIDQIQTGSDFDGQQAIAVGASARVNDNLTVKASVAANNEEIVWGAGAAFGW